MEGLWPGHSVGAGNDRRQARRKDRRGDRRPGRLLLLSRRAYAARKKAGASGQDIADAQAGHSIDPKAAAALAFALKLVEHRGQMTDADIEAMRPAGFNDGQIVEIIAHVALNLFTNYVNIALDVPLDFPAVKFRRAA
jgi:alkylhydroperoxidase family enzyme